MDLKLTHFSSADCRPSHSRAIERGSGNIIVIRDLPVSAHVKPLLWIMAGSIPVIAVVSVITSQSFIAVLALILVILGSIAFMSRQTITEINLTDRMIRKTWRIGAYARQKVYPLEDFVTVEIKDKGRMIEGYSLPLFSVQLIGRGKEIAIYSTNDSEEAKAMQSEVAAFLKQSALSTQRVQ
jgi:hypothetical protein